MVQQLLFLKIQAHLSNLKKQRDFDLHIAFEVTFKDLNYFFDKGKKLDIETRGISDHGFIKSIYFRDPNGYIIELTTPIKERLVNQKT